MTATLDVTPDRGESPRSGVGGFRRKLTFDRVSFMVVFLGLPLAIYLIFVVSPFIQACYYSLTDWSGFTPTQNFVGLANFKRIFTDDIFLKALRNNIVLALVLPMVTIIIAFIFASLVTVGGSSRGQIRGLQGSGFYRIVSFFPYVIPAIVIGIMWSQIYDPSNGLLNGILVGARLRPGQGLPLARRRAHRHGRDHLRHRVGHGRLLHGAVHRRHQGHPRRAVRGGPGRRRRPVPDRVRITLPLIRDNVQTAWIYLGILALDAFVYMAALNPGGGPNNSTLVMAQQLFTTAFTKGQFGVACAMGVVLAAVTLIFAGLVFVVNRLLGGKEDSR